jgi:ATP-dependent DNA helicase UvrD/PcrA
MNYLISTILICLYLEEVKKIKRIIFSKIKDTRDEIFRQLESQYKKKISSLSEEDLLIEKTNLDYKRKLNIRELISDVIKLKDTLQWLNTKDVLEIYNEINEDKELTQDDLAPILYLKIKFEGFKYNEEIKHVVIDEAQDMSALQFIVVKELTKSPAFTIVGDVNQRMIEAQVDIAMSKLQQIYKGIDLSYFQLNKSYRSTREIMEYANSYLEESKVIPIVRSGEKVVEKKLDTIEEISEGIIEAIDELTKKDYESIAVICSNIKEANSIYELIKRKIDIRLIDNEEIMYKKGNVILPMYFSKGLEFDTVVMISHEGNKKNNYVMATRALHELKVFK